MTGAEVILRAVLISHWKCTVPVPYCTVLYYLPYTVLYCTVQYSTVQYGTVQYGTVLSTCTGTVQYRYYLPYGTTGSTVHGTRVQYINMVPFRNRRTEVVPKSINFPGL